MKPYYQDDKITLYHGDAFEVIPELGRYDLMITDPPYILETGDPGEKSVGSRKKFMSEEFKALTHGFNIGEFFEIGDVGFTARVQYFIFCSTKQITDLFSHHGDYATKNLLVWHKTNAVPFANGVWKNDLEYIVHIRERGAYFEGDSSLKSKVFIHPIVVDDRHPTVKPIPLLRKFVEIGCPPGGTILDPFCGSGTTLRAAKDLNRRAIGIEKEERYLEVSVKRLQQEVMEF